MITHVPIQSQLYPNNINGFCTGGVIDSHFNSQLNHHQQQQQGPIDPSVLVHNSNALNSLEKSWQEIDQYIRLQNEQMRFMIQEYGKQQMATMLRNVESQSLLMLKEKDEEIAQAAMKRLELEHFIKKLEAENWIWKEEAQEKEAMVLALKTALEEQKKIIASPHGFMANDAESHWDETSGGNEEMKGEVGTGEKKVNEHVTRKEVMVCKSCHSRRACFLFLPCRHLASCKSCHAVLKACPVCGMPKKNSIEILKF